MIDLTMEEKAFLNQLDDVTGVSDCVEQIRSLERGQSGEFLFFLQSIRNKILSSPEEFTQLLKQRPFDVPFDMHEPFSL